MTIPFDDARAFVEIAFQVKSYDVDYNRHVHNLVYIRWLEDLRLGLMDKYFPLDKFLALGLSPVLLRTSIEYRKPIRLFEPVLGRMWIAGSSRVRFEFVAEFRVGDAVAALAEQTGAIVDITTGRPVRTPAEFLAAIA